MSQPTARGWRAGAGGARLQPLTLASLPRCPQIPPSYCARLVEVMRELQRRRQTSAVFAGKDGFITARDLLRCVSFSGSLSPLPALARRCLG